MMQKNARTGPCQSGWRASLPCLGALLLLAACGDAPSDPEAAIRAAIAEAESAAEAGEFELLASRVSRDYADRTGRDRPRLLLMIRGLLMRYPRLEIIVTLREVRVLSPELARARVEVLGAGAGRGGLSADAFPLELSLRLERGQWRVTRAEWGRSLRDGI